MTGRYKIVGYLGPSVSQKTLQIRYFWGDLRELVERLQKLQTEKTFVFLGQIQVRLLHESIHSNPMQLVEIDHFVNAYSPDRKTPAEIIDSIPLADPEKLLGDDTC